MTMVAGGARDGEIRIRNITYMKQTDKGHAIAGTKTIYEQCYAGQWREIPTINEVMELDSEI